MKLDYRPFTVPLVEPLESAVGPIESRSGFLVRVRDGDHVGYGEATPLPGWTESVDACETALERARETISTANAKTTLEETADNVAARHGVSLALADLEATAASTPLYQHLGEPALVGRVPVNATIGDGSPERTAAAIGDAVDRGFRCCKVKVGARRVREDIERIRLARDVAGPGVELRADANGAWTSEEAEEAISAFAKHDVSILEQPLPAGALAGHADLRGRGVRIALDEGLLEHGLDAIIEAGAADVVVLKPMALGGIDVAQEMAAWVNPLAISAIVTTTIDAVVARTAAVHLAAAIPDIPACGLATGELLAADLGRDPVFVEKGAAVVPQAKGIGVEDVWERRDE